MNAAQLFERAQDGDESVLDSAFEAVAICSRFHSTEVANAIAERWLWGTGWKVVAFQLGLSVNATVDRCRRAFEWMDRNCEIGPEGTRYTGV